MRFNNRLAILVVALIFLFVALAAFIGMDNKVVDLATGVFLAKFSDIIQFYFRRAPTSA